MATFSAVELGEIKADLKDAKVRELDESARKTCDITEHSMPHDKLAAFLGTDLERGLETKGEFYIVPQTRENYSFINININHF